MNMHHSIKTGLLVATLLAVIVRPAIAAPIPKPTGDVPEATGWTTKIIVRGLEHPWSIAWLRKGDALITERPGRLRLMTDGQLDPVPIAGVPQVCACGQGGLLDVALHPDFANNRLVYLTYAAGTEDANRTTLARGKLTGKRLTDVKVIFQNADLKRGGQHFGSRLAWLPDGTLLMSIGDGGNPPTSFDGENIRDQAQKLGTHFGKILRLRDDGSVPRDNPFVGRKGARPEIYSFGHRNIQGMVRDPASGRVWANEHASRGGDELNLIRKGQNYGWPAVTQSNEYWGPRVSNVTNRADVTDPIVVWTPSKAPSGLMVYSGDEFPQWRGDLLSGALKFQQIRHIDLKDGRVTGEEKLSIGQRVRDLRQGPDGGIYLLTDARNGQLLRIIPASP